jgi:hypothetical protein
LLSSLAAQALKLMASLIAHPQVALGRLLCRMVWRNYLPLELALVGVVAAGQTTQPNQAEEEAVEVVSEPLISRCWFAKGPA